MPSTTDEIFEQLASAPQDRRAVSSVRAQIVESCLPIAHHIAAAIVVAVNPRGARSGCQRRTGLRGEPIRPGEGRDFLAFAVPTMMGEVRKHFRDRGWDVRVPRSLQGELHLALKKAQSSLTQRLGREPTVPELAAELAVDPADIGEIAAAGDSYHAASLDATTVDDGRSLADTLGDFDAALDGIDNRETLRPALLASNAND